MRFVGREDLAEVPRAVVKGCRVAPGPFLELSASLFSAFVHFLKFNGISNNRMLSAAVQPLQGLSGHGGIRAGPRVQVGLPFAPSLIIA